MFKRITTALESIAESLKTITQQVKDMKEEQTKYIELSKKEAEKSPMRVMEMFEQMKKLATLLVIGAVAFMYSCGPSAKELEEKRIADSIRVADSLAMVQAEQQRIADSIAKVQEEKRKADSIAHQDSIAKKLIKPAKKMKEAKKEMKKGKK